MASVLSEREFSKSTHFLNPGRSLMTDEHLNDLCFLKDLFETTIKKPLIGQNRTKIDRFRAFLFLEFSYVDC